MSNLDTHKDSELSILADFLERVREMELQCVEQNMPELRNEFERSKKKIIDKIKYHRKRQ